MHQIRSDTDKTAIITIWVDDLLLFAELEHTVTETKEDTRFEGDTSDMGAGKNSRHCY
jgi:hypothetical protein